MTILHTCWRDAVFYVWGECEAAQSEGPVTKREKVPTSPYALRDKALAGVLRLLLRDEARNLTPRLLTLLLPTRRSDADMLPVPSQPFFSKDHMQDGKDCRQRFVLHPWRVTGAALTWRAALTLLNLTQERRLAEGVFAGESLLGVAALFRYAGAMVARGHFLPGMRISAKGVFEACWHPVLDGAECQRITHLARHLPPVTFATASNDTTAASTGPSPLLTALEELTDRLVRVSVVTTLSRAQAERGQFYSAHDAWFAALRGESRRIRWEQEAELTALSAVLQQWRRPVEAGHRGEAVPGFRLEAPQTEAGRWVLWVEVVGNDTTVIVQKPETWRKSFLLSLGQATLLFSPLARAESQSEGFGCSLTLTEAHAFLNVAADVLTASGYRVVRPPSWQQEQGSALALSAEFHPLADEARQVHTLDDRVSMSWGLTFNGEPLTPQEMARLEAAKTPLVFLRGQWLTVDLKRLHEALRVWRRTPKETQTARDAVRIALGATSGARGFEVAQVQASGWIGNLLSGLQDGRTFKILKTPGGFSGKLRPYQIRGFSWLVFLQEWGFGACLADDMGLGKTIQALAFLLHDKARGCNRPVLLAGPMSVLGNWLHEARRFAPGLRVLLHHGPQRPHGEQFVRKVADVDLVVTSYHLLYRDYCDLRRVVWSGLILDEAQNIKNPATRQAQAARALQADMRIALTGTPMENHVGELWSIMDFLNAGLLGRWTMFRKTYFRPIQTGSDPGVRARLRRVTAPFILRRMKTDRSVIADLPDKVESKVYCSLTSEQAALYREVLDAFEHEAAASEGMARRGMILAVLTRLKQVCNHPAHYLGQERELAQRSGKLERLVVLLEEVFARGESALIFTQYVEMGKLLKHHLCQTFAVEMPFLYGGLPRQARDHLVSGFQESTRPHAFILSLKAGGTGLNLTRASHVFHFDRWWNPAVENQATDRTFRIGQTRNVMVHKFICVGTLEERIDALIESKIELAADVVSSGEKFLTELSNDALHKLLRLDAPVVDQEKD